MQNAEAALRKGILPKWFIECSGGLCKDYQGKAVKAFTVYVSDYRLPDEASRKVAGPFLLALGLATTATVVEYELRKLS